jgi:hypothetical protein
VPAVRLKHGIARPLRVVVDGDGLSRAVLAGGLFREFAQAVDISPSPVCGGADKVAISHLVGVAQIDLIAMDLADAGFIAVAWSSIASSITPDVVTIPGAVGQLVLALASRRVREKETTLKTAATSAMIGNTNANSGTPLPV